MQIRRLQDVGLNAYESRAYLVLIGHARFKALEVAGRASIPRQKVYEVLDSLIEKGFVRVIQGKAKEFSAVDPDQALRGYLDRKKESFQRAWEDRRQLSAQVSTDLAAIFANGNQTRSPLDYLRIVSDTGHTAEEFRRMLASSHEEYLEFARPPFAVDPIREPLIGELVTRGVKSRLLFDTTRLEEADGEQRLQALVRAGAQVKIADGLPIKLALFDGKQGMISLDDPVVSHPQITALVFEHASMAEAMRTLFDDMWGRGTEL